VSDDPCNCDQALELHDALRLLAHAAESSVLAEPSPLLRRALDAAYAIGVPRPDEDDCPCEGCRLMRDARDAV